MPAASAAAIAGVGQADAAQDEPGGLVDQRRHRPLVGEAGAGRQQHERDHRRDMMAEPETIGRSDRAGAMSPAAIAAAIDAANSG